MRSRLYCTFYTLGQHAEHEPCITMVSVCTSADYAVLHSLYNCRLCMISDILQAMHDSETVNGDVLCLQA